MKSLNIIFLFFIIFLIFNPVAPGFAEEPEEEWTGTLSDGRIINADDLRKIVEEHEKYRKSSGKADLSNADLSGVNLSGANLSGTDLISAKLIGADLSGAILIGADLSNAKLAFANLTRAKLTGANLSGANLFAVDSPQVYLAGANLSGAYLAKANLRGANLSGANLSGADLILANLKETVFQIKTKSLPQITSIAYAKNLSKLTYQNAPLSLIELRQAFKDAGYRQQEREITYSIKHSELLLIWKKRNFDILNHRLAYAPNSDLMWEHESAIFRYQPMPSLDSIGFSEVTKLKLHYPKDNIVDYPSFLDKKILYLENVINAGFRWLFFELTCKWGMLPGRPLTIILCLIFLFTIPYTISIRIRNKRDGIWRFWVPDRARKDLGSNQPKLLRLRGFRAIKAGLYFSVLSAFNIGWRDLNVGNWIARMQFREYKLQASGWVRFVSGLQSLISVYLLALSVLTYFGRPFESY